jgi:hypothetical protein
MFPSKMDGRMVEGKENKARVRVRVKERKAMEIFQASV